MIPTWVTSEFEANAFENFCVMLNDYETFFSVSKNVLFVSDKYKKASKIHQGFFSFQSYEWMNMPILSWRQIQR